MSEAVVFFGIIWGVVAICAIAYVFQVYADTKNFRRYIAAAVIWPVTLVAFVIGGIYELCRDGFYE